jgi:hypothetical protein
MRKALCFLLAILLILPALALAADWQADPDGLKVYFRNPDEWTVVTKDNLDENMAVCLRRGDTEADVRARFKTGNIRWEAYHNKLPDGCVRYEVWEDELTRNVWNLNTLNSKERTAFMDALGKDWSAGPYRFINARFQSDGTVKHLILLGVISNLPLKYESGYAALRVANGKAFLTGYFQANGRASKLSYLSSQKDVLARLTGFADWDRTTWLTEFAPECADLSAGSDRIINAHTGTVRLRGTTEPGAKVTARSGDYDAEADVDADGQFTVEIPLTAEGNMAVDYTAAITGKADNTLFETVPIDDSKASLTLTAYPAGEVWGAISLKGEVANSATVTYTLDGSEPRVIPVTGGAFEAAVDAADFIPHTLTVTASEVGLKNCSVTLAFTRGYDDFDAGVKAFAKSLVKVTARQLADDPAAYTGSFIKMEFRVTDARYDSEGITLNASAKTGNKSYPMLLKANGYMDDMVAGGMTVTVYGIVEAPLPEDDLPCVRVAFLSYIKIILR